MYKVRHTNFEDPRAVRTIIHTAESRDQAKRVADAAIESETSLWPTRVEDYGAQKLVFNEMGHSPQPLIAVIEIVAPTDPDYGSCPGAPKASDMNTRPRVY